jgi:hypothetical protein
VWDGEEKKPAAGISWCVGNSVRTVLSLLFIECGMADYQVPRWDAWHNHRALVIPGTLFLVKQKNAGRQLWPILLLMIIFSMNSLNFAMAVSLLSTGKTNLPVIDLPVSVLPQVRLQCHF